MPDTLSALSRQMNATAPTRNEYQRPPAPGEPSAGKAYRARYGARPRGLSPGRYRPGTGIHGRLAAENWVRSPRSRQAAGVASHSPPFSRWKSGWNDSTAPAVEAAVAASWLCSPARSPDAVNQKAARPSGAVRNVEVNG